MCFNFLIFFDIEDIEAASFEAVEAAKSQLLGRTSSPNKISMSLEFWVGQAEISSKSGQRHVKLCEVNIVVG
jgi:hypothetical protein